MENPAFNSQYPCDGSQLPITPVPGELMPSDFLRLLYACGAYVYIHLGTHILIKKRRKLCVNWIKYFNMQQHRMDTAKYQIQVKLKPSKENHTIPYLVPRALGGIIWTPDNLGSSTFQLHVAVLARCPTFLASPISWDLLSSSGDIHVGNMALPMLPCLRTFLEHWHNVLITSSLWHLAYLHSQHHIDDHAIYCKFSV